MEFQIERIVKNIVGNPVESFKVIELIEAETHDGSKVNVKTSPQLVNLESLLAQKDKLSVEAMKINQAMSKLDKLMSDILTLKATESAVSAPTVKDV